MGARTRRGRPSDRECSRKLNGSRLAPRARPVLPCPKTCENEVPGEVPMKNAMLKAWGSICNVAVLLAIGLPLALSSQVAAQSPNNWLHFHKDEQITGWNPNETILTPQAVANGNFGLVWVSDPEQ